MLLETPKQIAHWVYENGKPQNGKYILREYVGGERYTYDFHICTSRDGWVQYDTDQDASYFGVWVHLGQRLIVTFAEGDLTTVYCPSAEAFDAELKRMNEFYDTSPAFMMK